MISVLQIEGDTPHRAVLYSRCAVSAYNPNSASLGSRGNNEAEQKCRDMSFHREMC